MSIPTPKEAREQAYTMVKQGQSYDYIAEHLNKIGFKSTKTGEPVTGGAVRAWVGPRLREEKQQAKSESTFNVSAKADDLVTGVRGLLDMGGISNDMKLKMMVALLSVSGELKS